MSKHADDLIEIAHRVLAEVSPNGRDTAWASAAADLAAVMHMVERDAKDEAIKAERLVEFRKTAELEQSRLRLENLILEKQLEAMR